MRRLLKTMVVALYLGTFVFVAFMFLIFSDWTAGRTRRWGRRLCIGATAYGFVLAVTTTALIDPNGQVSWWDVYLLR